MNHLEEKLITTNRLCPYLSKIALLTNVFTPKECKQIINTGLNDWKEEESEIKKKRKYEEEEVNEDLRRIRSHVMNEVEEEKEEKYKQLEFDFEDYNLREDQVAPI